jgi:hypothetical protein
LRGKGRRRRKKLGGHDSDDEMKRMARPAFGANGLTDEELARIRAENPELADELE